MQIDKLFWWTHETIIWKWFSYRRAVTACWVQQLLLLVAVCIPRFVLLRNGSTFQMWVWKHSPKNRSLENYLALEEPDAAFSSCSGECFFFFKFVWLLSSLCSSLSCAMHWGRGQRKLTVGCWSQTSCDWQWSFHWLFLSYESTLISLHFSLCSVSKSICLLYLKANTKYLTQVTNVKIKPLFKFFRVKMNFIISSEILRASLKFSSP